MYGTGYLHREPTLIERVGSAWRSRRVADTFVPTHHPRFKETFWRLGPWNQSISNACTGYASVMGLLIQAEANGLSLPRLSPLLPYWAARCRDAPDELITDGGAYVDDIVWAFNRFGAPSEAQWPFDTLSRKERERVINQRPPPSVYRAALAIRHMAGPMRMRAIVDRPERLPLRIAHSLHNDQVVLVALPVGDEFFRGVEPIPPQEPEGWHYVLVLDWRVNSEGLIEGLIGNSWGQWGNRGTAWASNGLLRQASAVHYMEAR